MSFSRRTVLAVLAMAGLALPALAFAQQTGQFDIPANDYFIRNLLSNLLGAGVTPAGGGNAGWLATNTEGNFGAIFRVFNLGVALFASLGMMVMVIVGTLQTGHDGEFLGRRWSSMWVPVRFAIGSAMLLPVTGSGYSLVQATVLFVAGTGIGFADAVWTEAVGSLSTRQQAVINVSVPARQYVTDLALANVCTSAVNSVLTRQGAEASGVRNLATFGKIGEDVRTTGWLQSVNPTRTAGQGLTLWNPGLSSKAGWGVPGRAGLETLCGSLQYDVPGSGGAGDQRTPVQVVHAAFVTQANEALAPLAEAYIATYTAEGAADDLEIQQATALAALTRRIAELSDTYANRLATEAAAAAAPGMAAGGNADRATEMRQVGFTYAGMYYVDMMRAQTSGRTAIGALPTVTGFDEDRLRQFVNSDEIFGAVAGTAEFIKSELQNLPRAESPRGSIVVRPDFMEEWKTTGLTAAWNGITMNVLEAFWSIGPNTAEGGSATNYMNLAWNAVGFGTADVDNTSVLMHLKDRGDTLLDIAWGIVAAQTRPDSATKDGEASKPGGASKSAKGSWFKNMVSEAGNYGSALVLALLAFGFTLAIIIPTMPYVLWVAGIIGLMVLIVEALIASVLWVVALMHPAGDGFASDQARNGMMLIMSLFFRPVLMLMGLIAGIFLIEPAARLINDTFFVMMRSVQAGSVNGPITVVGFGGVYTMVLLAAVFKAFSLIHALPDRIMSWINGGRSDLGESEFGHKLEQGGRAMMGVVLPGGGAGRAARLAAAKG